MRYQPVKPTVCMIASALLLAVATVSWAAKIIPQGVLGNSGEEGATLVRTKSSNFDQLAGVGVAVDRFGTMWSAGGPGIINRFTPDGRLIGQYPFKPANGGKFGGSIAIVGDIVVLEYGDGLCKIPVTAAPGTTATPINTPVSVISSNSHKGQLAAANKAEILIFSPVDGSTKPIATASENVSAVEMGDDGAIYALFKNTLHKFVNGQEMTDGNFPKSPQGERPQWIGKNWYSYTWHGTIRRFDAGLTPIPGVVLGGASGSFIGHLDENGEINNPRGMGQLRTDLYAVGGSHSVIHLLAWQPNLQQFSIARRIGAVAYAPSLSIDSQGRIWWSCGNWNWDDGPDAPLINGIPAIDWKTVVQSSVLNGEVIIQPIAVPKKNTSRFGRMDKELARSDINMNFPAGAKLSTIYQRDKINVMLIANTKGEAVGAQMSSEGRCVGDLGAIQLSTAQPIKEMTSLCAIGPKLFAAADGNVIEFAADGRNWIESRRWNSWPGDHLGSRIFVTSGEDMLWVSDSSRHRILAIDPNKIELLATFGQVDKAGDSFLQLNQPEIIAACGKRAVVFDSQNQRLIKMILE